MEGELWTQLYHVVMGVAHRWPRRKGVVYSDAWVLLVYLWAVLNDRPQGWACQTKNWTGALRDLRPLPTASTLSTRLNQASLRLLLEPVMAAARERLPVTMLKSLDAKPLPVGPWSKDIDAAWGRAAHAKAKGYKLFAAYDGPAVRGWRIGPMNRPEPEEATSLIPGVAVKPGYLLGDSLYDTNALHEAARTHGLQLVTPRKKPGTGLGHRRHDPGRLRSIDLLEGPGGFGRALYKQRLSIEQRFAQSGNLACGLSPLPNWVRRPHRVALWVFGKLLLLTCWNSRKQGVTG
jgi:hypothetical protein